MKIANIVSTSKVDCPEEFNVVNSIDNIIDGLPTLIIGYEVVDKLFPDFDVFNISLGEDKYWTFKRTEKRDKYEADLKWFISKVYTDLTNQLIYVFVDPIQYRGKTLIKIVRKIYSLKDPIAFLNKQMLYVYGDGFIFGIDLKLLAFMGVNTEKIKTKIKNITGVFLDEPNLIIDYKKNLEALGGKVRYLPYLYSIGVISN